MAKSKSHKYKSKGKRPQQKPQTKPQSQKMQDDDIIPASGNRQARRVQERSPQHSRNGKPMGLRILIIVMLLVMLLGFFIAPLIGSR